MTSKNPHNYFQITASLLTVYVHAEREVWVGLVNILYFFYGQVSELVLGRGEEKKLEKKFNFKAFFFHYPR